MGKATKAQTLLRVTEVVRIRLDGAKEWDVSEYVREQERTKGSPWELAGGQEPLSARQIRRYVAKADRLIAAAEMSACTAELTVHLARRESLFAKAVNAGDVKAALAVLIDQARLRGLYPADRHELTGRGGSPVVLHITEEVVGRPAAPPPRTIRLHPAQRDFLRSDALFRAFSGGIGSGKSWAGAYDLIRRAGAGRLYLVAAPTYAMLSDATFRTFLALAEELGVADPAGVRRSAPPSLRLRTGAEVLFRSADEPDRLRGPNLSGVLMDEASLMPVDAFTVLIGRLREAGEQGWLAACFTPKGRAHWTFETFATGRPNTALFRARTSDNPFLPAGFEANVRAQYTSALAAQELEGEFVDLGGALFRRSWFPAVDAAPGGCAASGPGTWPRRRPGRARTRTGRPACCWGGRATTATSSSWTCGGCGPRRGRSSGWWCRPPGWTGGGRRWRWSRSPAAPGRPWRSATPGCWRATGSGRSGARATS
jgi:hypothetical protein